MMKPQRVVFVQNQLDDMGGVSRWCASIATELSRRGYAVEIGGVTRPRSEPAGYYPAHIPTWVLSEEQPARWSDFSGPFKDSRYRATIEAFEKRLGEAARSRFGSYDRDTLVVFTQIYARERAATAVDEIPFDERFRVIGQYHNDYYLAREDKDHERAFRAYRDDDLFACLSTADAELFRKYGLNNSISMDNPVVIPEGVPLSSQQEKVVVSLSRYDPTKQIDHMIQAWSLVHSVAPDWELHLYGSGPDEERLRDLIDESGLGTSVKLLGVTSDAVGVLSNASLSVNSSKYEGFGLALGEAALVGVPSVVYACSPGIQEVVQHEVTGLTVLPNDVSALAHGLIRLIQNDELRMSYAAAAREYVSERFNVATVVDSWETVIRNTMR